MHRSQTHHPHLLQKYTVFASCLLLPFVVLSVPACSAVCTRLFRSTNSNARFRSDAKDFKDDKLSELLAAPAATALAVTLSGSASDPSLSMC
eukprot:3936867-Rhodomonas_salina.2